jgi:cytochrome c peroxidase
VALTAPYMHDGRFNTLEEVVEHYNSGIKANANLSPKLFKNFAGDPNLGFFEDENLPQNIGPVEPVRLGLTPDEKAALVAFLKTFTDEKLAKDIKFSNPF